MNQLVQLLKLSPYRVCRAFATCFVATVMITSCSKNDVDIIGKPDTVISNFHFTFGTSEEFDEQLAKEISVKLKLSISGIHPETHSITLLWDTLISKSSLYEYQRSAEGQAITAAIHGSREHHRRLVINYVIVYNKQGELITRTGAITATNKEERNIFVRI